MGLSIPKVRKLLAEAKSDNIAPIQFLAKPKKTHPNMLTGNCKKLYNYMRHRGWQATLTIVRITYISCVSQEFQRLRDHGYPYVCKRVDGHYEYKLK